MDEFLGELRAAIEPILQGPIEGRVALAIELNRLYRLATDGVASEAGELLGEGASKRWTEILGEISRKRALGLHKEADQQLESAAKRILDAVAAKWKALQNEAESKKGQA